MKETGILTNGPWIIANGQHPVIQTNKYIWFWEWQMYCLKIFAII